MPTTCDICAVFQRQMADIEARIGDNAGSKGEGDQQQISLLNDELQQTLLLYDHHKLKSAEHVPTHIGLRPTG